MLLLRVKAARNGDIYERAGLLLLLLRLVVVPGRGERHATAYSTVHTIDKKHRHELNGGYASKTS